MDECQGECSAVSLQANGTAQVAPGLTSSWALPGSGPSFCPDTVLTPTSRFPTSHVQRTPKHEKDEQCFLSRPDASFLTVSLRTLSAHSGQSLWVLKILAKVIERRERPLKHSPLSSDRSTVELPEPLELAAKARKKDPILPKTSTSRTLPRQPSPRSVLFHERSLCAGNTLWSKPPSLALTNPPSVLGPSFLQTLPRPPAAPRLPLPSSSLWHTDAGVLLRQWPLEKRLQFPSNSTQ